MGYQFKGTKKQLCRNLVMIGMLFWGFSGLQFQSYAEIQPFYNLAVTIDRANDDRFNEKIEVYVEKNGEYYADYDLNQINQYLYKTEVGAGVYRFYARVRYDEIGTYEVEPEINELTIGDLDYKDLHTVQFKITSSSSEEEEIEDISTIEAGPTLDENHVYTIDQIEELRAMQESFNEKADEAFRENERWEQQNNFLATHGIANPGVAAESTGSILPDHYYPDEDSPLTVVNTVEETESTGENEGENQSDTTGQKSKRSKKHIPIALSLVVIAFGLTAIRVYLKSGDINET